MKILLIVTVLALASQARSTPQAFVSHATGKTIATYTPDTDTIWIPKQVPKTLRVCFGNICKTPEQWLAK